MEFLVLIKNKWLQYLNILNLVWCESIPTTFDFFVTFQPLSWIKGFKEDYNLITVNIYFCGCNGHISSAEVHLNFSIPYHLISHFEHVIFYLLLPLAFFFVWGQVSYFKVKTVAQINFAISC